MNTAISLPKIDHSRTHNTVRSKGASVRLKTQVSQKSSRHFSQRFKTDKDNYKELDLKKQIHKDLTNLKSTNSQYAVQNRSTSRKMQRLTEEIDWLKGMQEGVVDKQQKQLQRYQFLIGRLKQTIKDVQQSKYEGECLFFKLISLKRDLNVYKQRINALIQQQQLTKVKMSQLCTQEIKLKDQKGSKMRLALICEQTCQQTVIEQKRELGIKYKDIKDKVFFQGQKQKRQFRLLHVLTEERERREREEHQRQLKLIRCQQFLDKFCTVNTSVHFNQYSRMEELFEGLKTKFGKFTPKEFVKRFNSLQERRQEVLLIKQRLQSIVQQLQAKNKKLDQSLRSALFENENREDQTAQTQVQWRCSSQLLVNKVKKLTRIQIWLKKILNSLDLQSQDPDPQKGISLVLERLRQDLLKKSPQQQSQMFGLYQTIKREKEISIIPKKLLSSC